MDDQRLFEWLDGELGAAEAEAVAAEVAADPALVARADAHRAMQARLTNAFAGVSEAPVPQPLLGAARGVIDLSAVRQRRRRSPSVAQWMAMAASLAFGIVIGSAADFGPSPGPASTLLASASLQSALDTRLASEPAASGPRIGLTFRDRQGKICRSFPDGAAQGLACRDGSAWAVRALMPAAEGQAGQVRMAAGPDPALAALIDRTVAGEPFDAAAEKASREAGWR